MKKGMVALLIFLALGILYYVGATLRCKSLAPGAAGRVGYGLKEGCFVELSGSRVPLK